MITAFGLHLDFSYRAYVLEGLINLVVQFLAIGDYKKCPVTRDFAQHFLRKEDHRVAFTSALRMPEYTKTSLVLTQGAHSFQRIVDTQKLVVFGDEFDRSAACAAKQGEIFYDIQQAALFACAANHGFEGDDTLFFLVADLLPLEEMLPASRHAADPALMSVREHNESVIPEQLGNGIFVVAQVVMIGVFQPFMRGLEFNQYKRQTIHKAHQVCPPLMHLASYPELRNEQEIVVFRRLPVDDAHRLIDFRVTPTFTLAAHLYLDTIF